MLLWRNIAFLALVQVTILYQASHSKYLGCFTATSSKDALNGPSFRSSNMTIEMCCSYCTSKGYNVYALQYGSHCHCGTHESNYGALGGAPESECNTRCKGAPTCGGEMYTAVFEGETYMGCYEYQYSFGGPVEDLTLQACLESCGNVYKYIGLKQGNKCYCGDALPSALYISNNSNCMKYGIKCYGGDRCGGSGKIAVWTSIENLEEDHGLEYDGCYKDVAFTLSGQNKRIEKCVRLCHLDHKYLGIDSRKTCFCGNVLPTEKRTLYKTMKLLHTINGTEVSYRLEAICNTTNTGYMKVWRTGLQSSNDSRTLPPLANEDRSTPDGITQGKNITQMTTPTNTADVIPWLKVYPFLITSFFLGCITVIFFVCLSRSYESRRVLMKVRKQMEKQDKINFTVTTETSRTYTSDGIVTNHNTLPDNTCPSVDVVGNTEAYNVVACTNLSSRHYEEVQKETKDIETSRQYTRVDRKSCNLTCVNPTEEPHYSVPTKPALPLNPPKKIIKQTTKKSKSKEKPKQTKGKTTSRPTYAPPSVHKTRVMTSNDETGTSFPDYSFPTKRVGQLNPVEEKSPIEEQRERVEFDFQPKNQIIFKKRSMFGENFTKSVILNQGADLNSIYSLPHKRPKSSSHVPVKLANNLNTKLDPPSEENKFEIISESPANKTLGEYNGSDDVVLPYQVNDVASSNNQGEINFYQAIDEGKIKKDDIYETIDKQDPSQHVVI